MSASLVFHFPVTIPAGTTQAAPLVTPTTFEAGIVDHIAWLFPPGCAGMVGIQIGARSTAILPVRGAQWFVTSGMTSGTDVKDMHDSGDWSVIGYNLGVNPHTVQVTFTTHRKVQPAQPPILAGSYALSRYPSGIVGVAHAMLSDSQGVYDGQ